LFLITFKRINEKLFEVDRDKKETSELDKEGSVKALPSYY